MARKRSTIQDVAKQAGVSKVTVSYVLNGRSVEARISKDTEQKVLATAKELGYTPNRIAKMLATKRTDTIAVALQKAQYFSAWSSFLSEAMHGITRGVVEADLDLLMHTRGSHSTLESSQPESAGELLDGRVDGVLALRDHGDPLLESILNASIPTVLFFSRHPDKSVCWVDTDNFEGGKIAARHLISLGHKRLSMVVGSDRSVSSSQRQAGFLEEAMLAGIDILPEQFIRIVDPSQSYQELYEYLASSHRPTGLFVWSDDVAFGCMRIASELGLKIPDELSIVGFDSTDRCDNVIPALTSIRQPIFEIGQAAVLLLAKLIKKEEISDKHLVFSPTLDLRASTAPARAMSTSNQHTIL